MPITWVSASSTMSRVVEPVAVTFARKTRVTANGPRPSPAAPTPAAPGVVSGRQRRQFLESRRGRRIYARRKKTVEPFNQWFKSLFELDARTWHRGLENNQTQILAAIFAYQLLVRYNHRRGNHNGQLRWILDSL